jgi:hypothetical protein
MVYKKYLFGLFYGVFVRFSTRGVKKHHKTFWEKPCQKLFAKKVEKKNVFPSILFIAFLAVSLHEEKTP